MSLHRFVYANGNPTNDSDPSGEDTLVGQMASLTIVSIQATLAVATPLAQAAAIVCAANAVRSAIDPNPLGNGGPCQLYSVRLQAQGEKSGPNYLEVSYPIGPRPFPVTVAEGLNGLQVIKLSLNKSQLKQREDQFRRAERFIRNGPPNGIAPPGKSFNGKEISAIRVDVEILMGINFKN